MELGALPDKHPNDPHPDADEQVRKINQVWQLRREGKSFAMVAEIMGMSSSTAHKLFKKGLMMQAPQGAEEERVLAIQQLDELYSDTRDVLHFIIDPVEKLKALAMLDKLLKSRRELLGLDAPTKFQGVIHNVDAAELELAQIIEKEKARAAEREARARGQA